jgi:hypothetical protein
MLFRIILLFVIFFCSLGCNIKHQFDSFEVYVVSFSYVPKDHAIYGRQGTFEVIIKNLSPDTVLWKKHIGLEESFDINTNLQFEVFPKESILKRVNVYLNNDQLDGLKDGKVPKLFLFDDAGRYPLIKHNDFAICNKVVENPCFEKRKLDIKSLRQF